MIFWHFHSSEIHLTGTTENLWQTGTQTQIYLFIEGATLTALAVWTHFLWYSNSQLPQIITVVSSIYCPSCLQLQLYLYPAQGVTQILYTCTKIVKIYIQLYISYICQICQLPTQACKKLHVRQQTDNTVGAGGQKFF